MLKEKIWISQQFITITGTWAGETGNIWPERQTQSNMSFMADIDFCELAK